jgi:8-oxo-dGTP diphosphatase
LLLVTGYNESMYWTPGGKSEKAENHEEVLRRELYEELDIHLVKLKYYLDYESINDITKMKQKVYCYIVEFKGNIKPKKEIKTARWFSKVEIGKINVPKSISNYLLPKLVEDKLI